MVYANERLVVEFILWQFLNMVEDGSFLPLVLCQSSCSFSFPSFCLQGV